MKYTYSLVEAAALWVGIDPVEVQRRIDANELKQAELAHEKAVANAQKQDVEDLARWSQQEFDCHACTDSCPDWTKVMTEDGYERRILNCTAGYRALLTKTPPEPRPVPAPLAPRSRTTPVPGEFSDLPKFEEHLSWLREAAASQDLPVTQENVRSSDLRAWLSRHFPTQRPTFLYPDQADLKARLEQVTKERDDLVAEVESLRASLASEVPVEGKSKSSYLNLIGALLALVATKDEFKTSDESIRNELRDVFGGDFSKPHGLSDSFLKGVFAAARRQVIASYPEIENSFISKKYGKSKSI